MCQTNQIGSSTYELNIGFLSYLGSQKVVAGSANLMDDHEHKADGEIEN